MKINVNTLKQQLNLKNNPQVLIKVDNSDEMLSIPWDVFLNQVSQLLLGYIPLSGTEAGNPVTGDIEVDSYNIGSVRIIGTKIDDNPYPIISIINGGGVDLTSEVYDTATSTTIQLASARKTDLGFQLLKNNSESYFGNPYKGFYSDEYFGTNYDDNTYVQKKYVDNAFLELDYGAIISAGGNENVQVITTGVGTGTASVDLLPTIPIGKDVTVSDTANDAGTNNIQIDAGVGNSITSSLGVSQDILIDQDGGSLTLRKVSEDRWMVIAKTY